MATLDLQEILDQCAFHRTLQLRIQQTDSGVTLESTTGADVAVDEELRTMHGGIVATLLDSAATFALIAQTQHDWVTVDLRIDYLRPTRVGETRIEGEVLRAGRKLARARAALFDADGACCAVAIGTFAPGA